MKTYFLSIFTLIFFYLLGTWESPSHDLIEISRPGMNWLSRPPFTAIKITAGSSYTCAQTTGGVECWGENWMGQLGDGTTIERLTPVNVRGLGSEVTDVASGNRHTCVITTGGTVKCWGSNDTGQLGIGEFCRYRLSPVSVIGLNSEVTSISSGDSHTCALTTNGGVKCWGNNDYGQLGDGTKTSRNTPVDVIGLTSGVKAISAGFRHTCALTTNRGVKCWGDNSKGQLGDGTIIDSNSPVDVIDLMSEVEAVSAGWLSTCVLTTSGGAKCWGYNAYGQLGDGTVVDHNTPEDVSGLTSGVKAIAPDSMHTCALLVDGSVKCWGVNNWGQLGDGTKIGSYSPVTVNGLGGEAIGITQGSLHTCSIISNGSVKCWGNNEHGQLGIGEPSYRITPVDVNELSNDVNAISTGMDSNCALTPSGGVKCWGENGCGQIGDGTTIDHPKPADVNNLTDSVTDIAVNYSNACAILNNGSAQCWGMGYGHLPVDVGGLTSGVKAISPGYLFTCALTPDGGVVCWGRNEYGQLGDGTTTDRNVPVNVYGLTSGVKAISSGYLHTCALTNDGGVTCWGSNEYGQLGDGTTINRNKPVYASGLMGGIAAISTGQFSTCALTTTGGVKCWGNNAYSQLGDGSPNNHLTPVDVSELKSGVTAIDLGMFHACAIIDGGNVKCWGWNAIGQLGDGTRIDRNTPVNVEGLTGGVTAISAGYTHTCALTRDGVKCWGSNYYGDLGNGEMGYRVTPVDVIRSLNLYLPVTIR
jgi:alpha-tubulin suppressor-like RCC1 family protein